MNRIKQIVSTLQLKPHPEGGFYKEVYRSRGVISSTETKAYGMVGERNFATSIYFLLTSENFSAFHRIKQDEIWHYYEGSPLLVHVINPKGEYTCYNVGLDFKNGEEPQLIVPAGSWFASSVKEKEAYSLVGCTVAPGFDFNDFELANRGILSKTYPEHKEVIAQLTRV